MLTYELCPGDQTAMTSLRDDVRALDDAMEAVELRGQVAPVAELLVSGLPSRLAHLELDPVTASTLVRRMRALVHPAAGAMCPRATSSGPTSA